MIGAGAAALIFIGLGSASDATPPPTAAPRPQIIIRRQIVIRSMRLRPFAAPGNKSPIAWQEVKGPRCVPARAIAGASLLGQRRVDLILRNRSRVRLLLGSSCPALDYYHGFYLTPGSDGLICADRETVRSRVGGECEIDALRVLRPAQIPVRRLTSDDR
jgi:hypothetical protein